MKIAVFGGSFNPIHNGHINLAVNAMDKLNIDKLIIIPVGNPCHKPSDNLVEGIHRINMCKLAFDGYNNVEVSSFEVDRTEQSYTSTTIHMLKMNNPNDEIFLIMGGDMFLNFDKWHCYEELKNMVTVCVSARLEDTKNDILICSKKLIADGVKVEIIKSDIIELSSTFIRDNIGKMPLPIPDKIKEYVLQNGLYGTNEDDYIYPIEKYDQTLKNMVEEKRYIHSVNVSKEAVRLAIKYGCNVNRAEVAGILHDICKRLTYDEQLQWIKKSDIIWDDATLKQEKILHGISAAEYIQWKLGVYNNDIIDAIRYHTTGRPDMSLLEKIIFVADLTSVERDYPDVDYIRQLADDCLEKAVVAIIKVNVSSIIKKEYVLSDLTAQTYNFYISNYN